MDGEEIKKACSILELFYRAKDHRALIEASQNQKLHPSVRDYANGLLLRPWLPWGASRKVIMFLLAGIIIFLAIFFQNLPLLFGLVVPLLFSPRVVGEVSMFIGKFSHSQR
jgi:hypothetical protein